MVNRLRRVSAVALIATATVLAIPASAGAVGSPGTVYALQIGRGVAAPSIEKIAADGTRLGAVPPLTGSGVEQLNAPVGIAVDAEGYLIVADSDGYDETSERCGYIEDGNPVNPGCGAILRINPDTGSTQVLTKGPKIVNPFGVLLPADGSIVNGGDDSLIVSDSSEGLIKVNMDLPDGSRESYFPGPGQDFTYSRANWDAARDPTTGDILAVNNGAPGAAPVSGPGCPGPQTNGYVVRYTSTGQFKSLICDPRLKRPRGIVIDPSGTAYVADPFSAPGNSAGYGAVYEINPQGQVSYFTVGDLFETPSGLAFDASGANLLVADEGANDPGLAVAGGIISVAGFGHDQSMLAQIGSYPIDVAVDMRGATPPDLAEVTIPSKLKVKKRKHKHRKPKTKVYRLSYTRVSSFDDDPYGTHFWTTNDTATGLKVFKVDGVKPPSKILFECTDQLCRERAGARDGKVVMAPSDEELSLEFDRDGLLGQFRIYAYRKSTLRNRSIGFVKDFTAGIDSNGGAYSKDTSKCLVYPLIKRKKGKPAEPKRVCGKTPEQVIAKDKKTLGKLLHARFIGKGAAGGHD